MTNSEADIERGAVIELLRSFYPPTIRNELLQLEKLVDRFDIPVAQWVTIAGTGVSVLKPQLHAAAIELFDNADSKPVLVDKASTNWTASLASGNRGVVILEADGKSIRLPSYWMLMSNSSDRVGELEKTAISNGLSASRLSWWRRILNNRRANDKEVDLLFQELTDTITHVGKNIEEEFRKEKSVVRDFVPIRIKYYENLVGKLTQGNNADSFLKDDYPNFLEDYNHIPSVQRISSALLSCWHARTARATSKIECNFDDLVQLIERTASRDSICAKAGLAEICLYKIEHEPRLIEHIWKLIDPILRSNEDEHSLRLLASMCMFIDAELATSKTFRLHPPFYRRLAAFSQACLIERVFIDMALDSPDYAEWCKSISEEFLNRNSSRFYIQNLCDMREEPHWLPDHISATSLKQEFISRLYTAAGQVRDHIPEGNIKSKLLDDVEGSLRKHLTSLLSFVPGPLEGAGNSEPTLPKDLRQIAIDQLEKDFVDADSFIATVNLAAGFQPDIELAELVAAKLEDAQYYLRGFSEEDTLSQFIGGIALLAAKTRSVNLAFALRRFVSRMRAFDALPDDSHHLVRSGLIAAAAFKDVSKWCVFLGEWLSPIAFGNITKSQASKLFDLLQVILRYVPVSNSTLAPAVTALEAFRNT